MKVNFCDEFPVHAHRFTRFSFVGDELYRPVFGAMTLAQALLVAREERRLARPIFFWNNFLLHYLILPEWPKPRLDQPVAAGIESYLFRIGDMNIPINANYLRMTVPYRRALTGEQVHEIKAIMMNILNAIMRLTGIPDHFEISWKVPLREAVQLHNKVSSLKTTHPDNSKNQVQRIRSF